MRRDADELRFKRIINNGYNLVKIWECEFDRKLKANHEMRKFVKTLTHIGENKLDVRDAYYGGRTNAIKLYHDCKNGEKIRYVDVCSLYPYVLKYFSMPVGVPKVLIGKDLVGRSPDNIEGIIKCKVLAPKDLFHPVLPIKMHSRLLFILCYTCALEKSQSPCTHNDIRRSFTGTYVANELRLAMQKGYQIIEMYEAWEYKTVKYNKDSGKKGLFSEYIDFFLKMKTEASGYPNWVESEAHKQKFIEDYLKNEGIKLDENDIDDNPGFRTLSKALLNYLYGKFGERVDKMKKMIVNDRESVVKLMSDPSIEVHSMIELSNDAVMFNYKNLKEANKDARYVNVAIAAYTTAHARTVLYKYLDKLNKSVLYFDTDSVIYLQEPGSTPIETGDLLGDMTNELKDFGKDAYIQTFVSGGAKNYAYKVKRESSDEEKFICKVKGIRLNYLNSKSVNFESIKKLLFSSVEKEGKIELSNKMILRRSNNIIYTCLRKYNYKINASKRRRIIGAPFQTLPYGYE